MKELLYFVRNNRLPKSLSGDSEFGYIICTTVFFTVVAYFLEYYLLGVDTNSRAFLGCFVLTPIILFVPTAIFWFTVNERTIAYEQKVKAQKERERKEETSPNTVNLLPMAYSAIINAAKNTFHGVDDYRFLEKETADVSPPAQAGLVIQQILVKTYNKEPNKAERYELFGRIAGELAAIILKHSSYRSYRYTYESDKHAVNLNDIPEIRRLNTESLDALKKNLLRALKDIYKKTREAKKLPMPTNLWEQEQNGGGKVVFSF